VPSAEVTVIIPTIGDDSRAETIWRAIDSAGARSGAATRVLVVVNGTRYSEALVTKLRASSQAECVFVERAGMPLALYTGRQNVGSEFFAFLDDDDEILEDGLRTRLEVLRANPNAAFVVSSGWLSTPENEQPQVALNANAIEADPLGCLLVENWMATSASGLYRTNAVTAADFEHMPSYLEWTYLGFRLASKLEFRFIDTPTYRRYDRPGTVSKSPAYRAGMVAAIKSIMELNLPEHVYGGLRRKLGAAHHQCSILELSTGSRLAAWRHHLRSLVLPGGLGYLSFTRHLLLPSR
jgi:glycosyltransferase involved in cell wall biosynthesis